MEKNKLYKLLANLKGDQQKDTGKKGKRTENLQQSLAEILLSQESLLNDIPSDLVEEPLAKTESIDRKNIAKVLKKVKPLRGKKSAHIKVRKSAFKTTNFKEAKQTALLKNMVPVYAGARIEKTKGPFTLQDGTDLIFDYYPIFTKLNSLYIEGQTLPALLFKTRRFRLPIILQDLPFLLQEKAVLEAKKNKKIAKQLDLEKKNQPIKKRRPLKDKRIKRIQENPEIEKEIVGKLFKQTRLYELAGNTIWIRAKLLSSTAPEDHYCALRIKKGSVFLDKLPTKQENDKITVSKTTSITVNLNLEQKEVAATNDSIFGIDARNTESKLPKKFSFSLKNKQSKILSLADAYAKLYDTEYELFYNHSQDLAYKEQIASITIPITTKSQHFNIKKCEAGLVNIEGKAALKKTYWTLFSNPIDLQNPLEADSNGGLLFETKEGLTANIKNREEKLLFTEPFIFFAPKVGLLVYDEKSNGQGLQQNVNLWKDKNDPKAFASKLGISYNQETGVYIIAKTEGEENLATFANLDFSIDRPVKVNAEPVAIKTKKSILYFIGKEAKRGLSIIDFDILDDNFPNANPKDQVIKPIAFALQNALLTTSPPMGVFFKGTYDENFQTVNAGELISIFGLFSYLPTLPDPYASSFSNTTKNKQKKKTTAYRKADINFTISNKSIWSEEEVTTDFQFGTAGFTTANKAEDATASEEESDTQTGRSKEEKLRVEHHKILKPLLAKERSLTKEQLPFKATEKDKTNNIGSLISEIALNVHSANRFSLLDVSSNANQIGISYKKYESSTRLAYTNSAEDWDFPFKMEKMAMLTQGINAQAFMLPQISWEPIFNFSEQVITSNEANDPRQGFNYFPNDGFPTYIGNLSKTAVPLAPIPLSNYLEKVYKNQDDAITYASFNLPFGMWGLSVLDKRSGQDKAPTIKNVAPKFKENIKGGIQLELTAGSSFATEGDLFQGMTIQLANVQDMGGRQGNYSTLGASVHKIFNNEFGEISNNLDDVARPGVPLNKIGLSGYGANIFSDWYNKNAAFAETSQATFNVATGRTAQEVVQVKSIIYPWGIFVVRTITILRLSNGYIARLDSGWQAESDGKFYFGINNEPNPYEYHAGLVHGLYNIRNIREDNNLEYKDTMQTEGTSKEVILQGLTFDADIAIEDVIEGQNSTQDNTTTNLVASKGVQGFVQLSPPGTALTPEVLERLLKFQNNSIGGPVNCTIKIAGTDQYMKINRIDVNNAKDENEQPIFIVAARGSVVLPKEGSWTMVKHTVKDGTVTPLDTAMSVPLIRKGKWDLGKLIDEADLQNLQRIANPTELLRQTIALDTINYGFLQNLDTQKVLFLTPSFQKGINKLLSKTPPLLADGYRLLNSKGIFPNIGDAVDDFGETVELLKGKLENGTVDALFQQLQDVTDGAKKVYELLEIIPKVDEEKLIDQGYQLLKKGVGDEINKALNFDIPFTEYNLIDTEHFKIRIDYESDAGESKLDYNLDSFAEDLEDQWRGRLNNLAMVVSLGPFDDLMTVQGNFNNEKGKEANFGGVISADVDALPTPKIKFSDAVEPVIQILEILKDLSSDDYADALKKGLQVAMSNNANIWEYKYEAKKEIGLIQFPMGDLYNSPQVPLKLEASMRLGFNFNAALKVTSNPKDLLPTAGAFFIFHGGLQVMCVSIGGATIYAIGNVDLKLTADTAPALAVAMKFGFGAQLAVGLPVVGNASLQFMTSIEVNADTGNTVAITAIMMFRGHAELLGGAIGVTIVIEAKGAIEKSNDNSPTNCRASVAFGLDISVAFFIDISFHEEWEETRQIA
ncbi:hypothetical protein [Haloflavibacter putidus]|uniref:Uncharacterized protein n=1 Tax=Haloflavibacter putidus TaxID=2576776 RepID=A0A507ZTX3_9FLAO|nr:hypothetical protein [Haloflavibacter putidus]TQD39704.1 hypothetical protein FKR84_04205 [Haloflavibacter putidus]